MPEIPCVALSAQLPRLIHRIHLGGELPSVLQANLDADARLNSGWRQHLYGEDEVSDFTLTHYGREVHELYERLNPNYLAARSDLFRYLVMYRLGGVYLDTKSRAMRPLDEVVRSDEQFIVSQWRNGPGQPHAGHGLHRELAEVAGGEFQQWHIVARAGHPFLAAVIARVLENIRSYKPWTGVGRNGVVRVTGPVAYTQAINPLLGLHPHRRIKNEHEISLEFSCVQGSPFTSVHYSNRTDPVVEVGPVSTLLTRGLVAVQDLRTRLRRRG